MTTEATVRGAQTVSIRRANGGIQQINRDEVERYLSRGWSLDTVATIGNGVYNVILERGNHPNRNGKFELTFFGGVKIRYRRWHRTIDAAQEVAHRVLSEIEDRAAHPAIIYGPECGRDGTTIA